MLTSNKERLERLKVLKAREELAAARRLNAEQEGKLFSIEAVDSMLADLSERMRGGLAVMHDSICDQLPVSSRARVRNLLRAATSELFADIGKQISIQTSAPSKEKIGERKGQKASRRKAVASGGKARAKPAVPRGGSRKRG